MSIKVWGNFLVNEKLDPEYINDADSIEQLIVLTQALATIEPDPRPFRMYKDRIICRELVCLTAMELGIDLTAIKSIKCKQIIGRGLLDTWNKVYKQQYGSVIGTTGYMEAKRRDIVTKLGIRRQR